MSSVVLSTTARQVLYIVLAFSVFLLMRGHNEPGGGFIGGLLAASGIVTYYISFGLHSGDQAFPFNYLNVSGAGLLLAMLAGIGPMFLGYPFLTAGFQAITLPAVGTIELSSVLVFDVGVYLVVIGTVMTIVRVLVLERRIAESESVGEDGAAWRP